MKTKILKIDRKEKIASIRKEVNAEREKEKQELAEQKKDRTETDSAERFFDDKGIFLPSFLADEIVGENDLLYRPSEGFYQYNARGYWEKVCDEVIRALIDRKLRSKSKKSRVLDAQALVATRSFISEEFNHKRNLLNLKNGMLDIHEWRLLPHKKDYFSTIQLKVNYFRDAKCSRWLTFLDEILESNQHLINIIQEFFGYCLIPDTRYEKMIFLVGDGSNGKSTLIAILTEILGSQNVATVALNNLEESFHRVTLYQKLVNISTEFEIRESLESGYIKSIVSGDPIDACFKFRDIFSFRPFARLIVAMNELPRVPSAISI